jgi:hypothetical protein
VSAESDGKVDQTNSVSARLPKRFLFEAEVEVVLTPEAARIIAQLIRDRLSSGAPEVLVADLRADQCDPLEAHCTR